MGDRGLDHDTDFVGDESGFEIVRARRVTRESGMHGEEAECVTLTLRREEVATVRVKSSSVHVMCFVCNVFVVFVGCWNNVEC